MAVQPFPSPLRYPGGKLKVANYVKLLFVLNNLMDGHYAEPYAGGCSVALSLLFGQYASKIFINDKDDDVYAFWHSVLNETEGLLKLIRDAKLDMDEWTRQRGFLDKRKKDENYNKEEHSQLERGFAVFYLNRTNRSGIIEGGVIGGQKQTGKWLIDARFNRKELSQRIEKIARQKDRISLHNLDALDFIDTIVPKMDAKRSLIYLDPPYYNKGQGLYYNAYGPLEHAAVADEVAKLNIPWLVSYDTADKILELYSAYERLEYGLYHSAANHTIEVVKNIDKPGGNTSQEFDSVPKPRRKGKEVMFFSDGLIRPQQIIDPSAVTTRDLHNLPLVF